MGGGAEDRLLQLARAVRAGTRRSGGDPAGGGAEVGAGEDGGRGREDALRCAGTVVALKNPVELRGEDEFAASSLADPGAHPVELQTHCSPCHGCLSR
eukprot:746890-Hanusia_phi.AAC.1